jgi:hypothetical protein
LHLAGSCAVGQDFDRATLLQDSAEIGARPQTPFASQPSAHLDRPLGLPEVGSRAGRQVTRLMLLIGQFNYGKRGIFDMTHHRPFTSHTLRQLLEQGGFAVTGMHGTRRPIPLELGVLTPARLLLRLKGWLIRLSRSLLAYQVIAVAKPRLSLDYLLAEAQTQSQRRGRRSTVSQRSGTSRPTA